MTATRPSPGALALILATTLLAAPPGRAQVVFAASLPAPDRAGGLADQNYRIGPQDELDLVVFQDKDLTQKVVVDDSGRIVLPLVGPVVAAGKTPEGLAAEVTAKLKEKYFQDPQVGVSVSKAVSQKITVEGEVAKPGVYQMTGRTTLIQAIALASGADQYADFKHVAVFRYVDNQRYAAIYNLDKVNKGQAPDPEIFKNDIIVVEKAGVRTAFRDYLVPLAPLVYIIPALVPKL